MEKHPLSFAQEKCIEKFKSVHGDRYDYSQVVYFNNSIKVKIICKEHGVFEQSPANHFKGARCHKCYVEENRVWTEENDKFLKDNYVEKGGHFCAKTLVVTLMAVQRRAFLLGLRRFSPRVEKHPFIPSHTWYTILRSSKARGHEINIDQDYIWSVFKEQNGKCALTGREISFLKKGEGCSASVDRIDSSKGYVKGNIQIVDWLTNLCKSDFDELTFYKICKSVAEYRAHDLGASLDASNGKTLTSI